MDATMELHHLQAFVEIARTGQVTRAATRLHISQPALSQQLRRLERRVGTELLIRGPDGVVLTQAGELLLARAVRILAEVGDAEAELRALQGLEIGRVRLGTTQWPGPVDVPELLGAFHAEHPQVELTVRETTAPLSALVLADELDLALAVLPHRPDERLGVERVHVEELVLVVGRGHALARRRAAVLTELADDVLVAFRAGSALAETIAAALQAAGVHPRTAFETSDLTAARELVARDLGVTILPRSVAEQPGPEIHLLEIAPVPPTRTLALLWRSDRRLAPAPERFRHFALARMGAESHRRDRPA